MNENNYSTATSYKIDAEEADYLYIHPSQIPNAGDGLYTAIAIYKDEVISLFKGEILTNDEAVHRAQTGKDGYFINMIDGTIMDSMKTMCFAKYANDADGITKTKFKVNAKISLDEEDNVCVIANRNIQIGEEIFCSYGKEYWKNFKK
jgi:uncharacterized protein